MKCHPCLAVRRHVVSYRPEAVASRERILQVLVYLASILSSLTKQVSSSSKKGDEIRFPVEGFDGGSISMLSVKIG